ncbi:hypothetical protein QQ045_029042 [Rhodiola kirilowii]
MGFPVGYTEVFLPKLFLQLLSLLGFIRGLIISLFHVLGLSDFLETDVSWPEPTTTRTESFTPASAQALREILPVMKLEDLKRSKDVAEDTESCAVCLCEIEEEEEVRWLENCKHIFHRCCLDRWMDHDQTTCPLCRTPFVLNYKQTELDQQHFWVSSESEVSNQFF